MINPYAKMLGINESRRYSIEEIATYKIHYERLLQVDNELSRFHSEGGFRNKSERLDLSNRAWKAVREYEAQVPQDLQQLLNFDTVSFSIKMVDIFKQNISSP